MRVAEGATAMAMIALVAANVAHAETIRITCHDIRGSYVRYVDNPAVPADHNRKVESGPDAISGITVELTYSTDLREATLVTSGNANAGYKVVSNELSKLSDVGFISFVGIDKEDGSILLLSYFPAARKLLWSLQNDRVVVVDRAALAKTFIGDCVATKLN